ncbi:MAG: serine protease [bacterium]|nr:hypothetical protein [Planctomycetota bacterium]HIL52357.1 hypothetical protein [Planctomycetota bacterium]
MSKWLLFAVLLALFGSVGLTFVDIDRFGGRLQALESDSEVPPAHVVRLASQLDRVRVELRLSEERLERYRLDRAVAARFGLRLDQLEAELVSARGTFEDRIENLKRGDDEYEQLLAEALGARWEDLNKNLDRRWEDVNRTLEATARLAADSQISLQDLSRSIDDRTSEAEVDQNRWRELMGPTVQLTDESTVGSGVLLRSERQADGTWLTYLLTAWHVVRDILDNPMDLEQPVPVHIYRESGGYDEETALLVVHDSKIDAALLVMNTAERFDFGAALAARKRLGAVHMFEEIYAVGCPLGNDPIPTRGEIADVHHRVDGERYWMISAPTYIGNSGGGIFDADSHELLGIFSKIYTHGNLRPTVIPHMGLVTPLSVIYDWLESVGHGHLIAD